MKKLLCLVLALLMAAFTACQPTPEEETVHQKGAENEEKWMEPAPVTGDEAGLEVSARWEEKLNIREDLQVEIEAHITVPETDTFPIYGLKPTAFDKTALDNLVEKLFPNTRMQLKSEKKSREELEYDIQIEKNAIENIDKNHPEFTDEERAAYIADAQEHLESLLEAYQNLDKAPAPVAVERVSDYVGKGQFVTVEVLDGETGSILGTIELSTAKDSEEDKSRMCLRLRPKNGFSIDGEAVMPDVSNAEEVEAAATRLLEYIGFAEEYAVERVYSPSSYEPEAVAICTRRIGDALETFVNRSTQLLEGKEEAGYAPSVGQDSVSVYFDSKGVEYLTWDSPKKLLEVENENAKLLSFEEIQEKARTAFAYIAAPGGTTSSALYYRMIITDIRLGYMTVKRAGGGYSTIPVWDFFGYYYGGYESQEESGGAELDENNEHRFDDYNGTMSMLTLNALDGSILDRFAGY